MRPEDAIDDLGFIFDKEIAFQKTEKKRTDEEWSQIRGDYRDVFLGTAAGKRVLMDLLNECGVFESNFTRYSANTFYNEGKSDIGLLLLNHCFNLLDREKKDE